MPARPVTARRRLGAIALLAVLGAAAACGDDTALDRPTCAAAIADAADAIEVSDQVRHLDDALLACGSHGAYVAELASHPGLIGYSPEAYVQRRCGEVDDVRLRRSPTCRVARPPTTPAPAATAPAVVYAAATLDGRVVELRPSPAVPFDGDVPAVVQETVDIAVARGCPGVLAQRDLWAAQAVEQPPASPTSDPASNPTATDIASAYAQHAIHVALWIGCEGAELAPPGTSPATTDAAVSR